MTTVTVNEPYLRKKNTFNYILSIYRTSVLLIFQ